MGEALATPQAYRAAMTNLEILEQGLPEPGPPLLSVGVWQLDEDGSENFGWLELTARYVSFLDDRNDPTYNQYIPYTAFDHAELEDNAGMAILNITDKWRSTRYRTNTFELSEFKDTLERRINEPPPTPTVWIGDNPANNPFK